ncbi:MAG: hypothetical protein WA958_20570 [Tunicatimonas sp.]
MLKKVLLLIVLPLSLLAVLGYYWLGGFNSIDVEVVQLSDRIVVGRTYQGTYGDLALREIFVKAKQQQERGAVLGILTVVNRDAASGSGEEVNQLIGITLSAPIDSLPAGYVRDTLAAGTYLRARVAANSLAQPRPRAINERLEAYAAEHGLTVSGLPIEIYRASDTLWVEMAVTP